MVEFFCSSVLKALQGLGPAKSLVGTVSDPFDDVDSPDEG
jgi:hypothetical protein